MIVVGQDIWEDDLAKVEPFVKQMGDKMTYRVALDLVEPGEKSSAATMATTWMTTAGEQAIPIAFVVNKLGKIAWIGYPMEINESLVEQVLDGSFDEMKAATDKEKEHALSRQLYIEMKARQWDKAEAILLEMEKALPESLFRGYLTDRFSILLGKGDARGATALAARMCETQKDEFTVLTYLAWQLATHEGFKDRDLELAARLATRANEVAGGKEATILKTLARVRFMQGKKDKAVELQELAVKYSEAEMKKSAQETLDSYRKGKLPNVE